jgi:hypothetical protein
VGIEQTVRMPTGEPRRGSEAAAEVLAFRQRLAAQAAPPTAEEDPPRAPISYVAMNTIPEQWIQAGTRLSVSQPHPLARRPRRGLAQRPAWRRARPGLQRSRLRPPGRHATGKPPAAARCWLRSKIAAGV